MTTKHIDPSTHRSHQADQQSNSPVSANPPSESAGHSSSGKTDKRPSVVTFLLCLPLYIAVPVLFALLFQWAGYPLDWAAVGIGALGWIVALILRGPIMVIANKLMRESATKLTVVGSSGPLEELVRLGVLALTSFTFSNAASIGQGWAAIEVIYAIINGFALVAVLNRDDEKSKQTKQLLEQQGFPTDVHPIVGVIERFSASAFHIGSTLLVAYQPWLVVVLIPLHSCFNLGALRLMKRSMLWTQVYAGIIGIAVLAVSFLIWM